MTFFSAICDFLDKKSITNPSDTPSFNAKKLEQLVKETEEEKKRLKSDYEENINKLQTDYRENMSIRDLSTDQQLQARFACTLRY